MSISNLRLIDLIRQRFDAGVLPREHPEKVFGGYGFGHACNGCGDPMRHGQGVSEFVVGGQTYHLHAICHGLWEGELIRRGLFKPYDGATGLLGTDP